MNTSLLPDGSHQAIAPISSQLQLSVVVPVYNEVESIPRLIEAIATTLQANRLHLCG
jgi:hypothetical protein